MNIRLPHLVGLLLCAGACHGDSGDTTVASKIEKAEATFYDSTTAAKAAYRRAFSEAIGGATKIEVYLLDFEMTDAQDTKLDVFWATQLPGDQFPIIPYKNVSKILKRKKLSANEVALLIPELQAMIAVEKTTGGPLCHYPIHGVRIWNGDDIIFQTSICYGCMNFYMSYPFSEASWVGLDSSNIQKVMEQLVPIPQSEIDRLEGKEGGGKKPATK